MADAKMRKGGPCPVHPSRSNFHAVWDGTLIRATTWSWGAYVDRLEGGWLTSPEAKGVDGGTPAGWAEQTHAVARRVWDSYLRDTSMMRITPRYCRRSTGSWA